MIVWKDGINICELQRSHSDCRDVIVKGVECEFSLNGKKNNLIEKRFCLISRLNQNNNKALLLFKLRQLGDDSLDHFWRFIL